MRVEQTLPAIQSTKERSAAYVVIAEVRELEAYFTIKNYLMIGRFV